MQRLQVILLCVKYCVFSFERKSQNVSDKNVSFYRFNVKPRTVYFNYINNIPINKADVFH